MSDLSPRKMGILPYGKKIFMKERRYDIDWVRVVATLAVFVFHSGLFFDKLDWHLKNAQQSLFLTVFVAFLDLWMMPLLFLLSGLGAWYSLKFRSSGQYLLERIKRLLIPLYTVGAFILLPPQFYFELVTHATQKEVFKNTRPAPGKDFRLIVRRQEL